MKKKKNRLTADAGKSTDLAAAITKMKNPSTSAIEEAYLQKKLVDRGYTQEEIALATGKSRSAVANTLRLLTLEGEVLGMIESGELSAGHARALVKVPKEKQYAFAVETVKGGYSVRQTERAVKVFLTPPEVLMAEKNAAATAKSEELRAFVERMRAVFRLKVSLVGNGKKGRVSIDYFSPEDLYRLEECVETIEKNNLSRE